MVLALNKEKIASCFLRSLPSYDEAALVQRRLAQRLMDEMGQLQDAAFKRVLEVGCGTGVLSEMICDTSMVQTLWLNDLLPEFEKGVMSRLAPFDSVQCRPCFGDIEAIPLPIGLTLVISGATFQWLDDLKAFIAQLAASLQSGAYLAFSLFGQGTLHEFAQLTQAKLHYHSDAEIGGFLATDFEILSRNSYSDVLYFKTVQEILQHIRATGVGGVSGYQWSKESLRHFKERYPVEFELEQGLPVSYTSSCYLAKRR
jgi:malonyl-CoA O-methyltransferase